MSENYFETGYLVDGYIQNTTGLIFDPSGVSSANAVTGEVHNNITEPDIWFIKGPFYGQSLVITGVKKSNLNTTVTLQHNVDFVFSPVFNIATSLTGLNVYSYILLTDYTLWDHVTVGYQAVGLTDTFLLHEIILKGNFDRTVLTNWTSLQGDINAFANGDYSEGLKNQQVAYTLARQLNAIAGALSAPSSYLEFINGRFAEALAKLNSVYSTVESWKSSFDDVGLLSGPVITETWVTNTVNSMINSLVSIVTSSWVNNQIDTANDTLHSQIQIEISSAISSAMNGLVTTNQLNNYVSTSALASTLTGYATLANMNSVINTGWIIASLTSIVPSGFMAMPTAPTLVSKSSYANLFAVYGDTFTPIGNNDNTKFGLPYMPPGVTTVAGTLGQFTVPSVYYSTSGTLQTGTPNNLGAGINTKFLIKL